MLTNNIFLTLLFYWHWHVDGQFNTPPTVNVSSPPATTIPAVTAFQLMEHGRRLHGLESRMELLLESVAEIRRNVAAISDISTNVAELRRNVAAIPDISTNVAAIHANITAVKKILTGDVIRFPKPSYGDENTTRYLVQGHVEILHDNVWGTVCDDSLDDHGEAHGNRVANLICMMGGYQGGRYDRGRYKQPSAPKATKIWLDWFYCSGTESSLGECVRHREWGDSNCNHDEDIGIRCYI